MILLISSFSSASDTPPAEDAEAAAPKLAIYALWSKPAPASPAPLTSQCAEAASFETQTETSEPGTTPPEPQSAPDPQGEFSAPAFGEEAPCRWDLVEAGVAVASRDIPALAQQEERHARTNSVGAVMPGGSSLNLEPAPRLSELCDAQLTGSQSSGVEQPQTKRVRTKPALMMPLDERDAPCADCSW